MLERRFDRGDGAVEEHGRRLDVLHDDAAGIQALRNQLVELRRQEMEGHERPAIGVDQNDVERVLRS